MAARLSARRLGAQRRAVKTGVITICLGFWNWHEPHLLLCLQSLQSQYLPVIVVDGSGLKHPDRLGIMGARHVHHPIAEGSRRVALNVAAKHATTPYLCFTDADLLFAQTWRSAAEAAIAKDGHPTRLWLTDSRDLNADVTTALHARYTIWDDATLSLLSTPHDRVGMGAAMLVDHEWFLRVGGFDEFYRVWGCEDNDLALRAQWSGVGPLWLDGTFVAHQYHARTASPEQMQVVEQNRAYLKHRIAEKGPIIRNKGERL